MVCLNVETTELNRVIRSVKKGIDKKRHDEFRGIRFVVDGDMLRAYTSDNIKVFTDSLKLFEKAPEIEDGFEFVSPVIRFPSECENLVKIKVDYEQNTIEYDFGLSKQIMQLYYLNIDFNNIKSWFATKGKTEILFNAKVLKTALDGFDKDEKIKLIINNPDNPVIIQSTRNQDNKRIVSVMI